RSQALTIDDDGSLPASFGTALSQQGWWCGQHIMSNEMVIALRHELAELMEADRLHRAGIGRHSDFQIESEIRRDRIFWLSGKRAVQQHFLTAMEQLRLALNRELFLGLFEFEGHFAHYPPGGFYRRHLDSFQGAANRVISTVTYLNPDWQPGDGGELVIYAEDSNRTLATIEPRAGTQVLFLSEQIPHEVLTAHTDRTSIAGWFRLNTSIQNQIDPPE
ncbi:MAG: 2OG-Fe(II) oxygenase, partial [Wenzhouxiangella sp.]